MIRLENWSVTYKPDPWAPPELLPKLLRGNVYNHPDFADGSEITTSAIVEVTAIRTVITNSGHEYKLGEPAEDYEKQFPNAKERFFTNAIKMSERN